MKTARAKTARQGARRTRAANLRLRADDVDIWRAQLDGQPEAAQEFLRGLISADEAERAGRFYFELERRRFIVGRGILRMMLARYTGRDPRELIFRYGANGKPALIPEQAGTPPLQFSVAHSGGLALFAFSRGGELGIDLEQIRALPEWPQISAACLLPREAARVYAAAPEQRREEFFRGWTRQEALFKALGSGPTGAIDVRASRPRANGTAAAECNAVSGGASFRVYSLDPAPGYVAAIAVGPDARWTACRTWRGRESFRHFPALRRSPRVRLEQVPQNGVSFL